MLRSNCYESKNVHKIIIPIDEILFDILNISTCTIKIVLTVRLLKLSSYSILDLLKVHQKTIDVKSRFKSALFIGFIIFNVFYVKFYGSEVRQSIF